MANSEKETRLAAKTSDLTTPTCPPVANLIEFALGRASAALSDQVRDHLLADNCNSCRSWVEQAAQYCSGPPIDRKQVDIGPLRHFSSSSPSPDPTPIPENAKWQRQAFRDLEARLRALETS